MANILIVDDEKGIRRSLSIALEGWGYQTVEAASVEKAISLIEKEIFEVVITDLKFTTLSGIDLLRKVKELSPGTEVLMISARSSVQEAVEAMRQGAFDFIVKPFSMDHMEIVLKKMVTQQQLKQTVKQLSAVLADRYSLQNMIAVSDGMRKVMREVSLIADWAVPVLVQGESGVGKELVAMAIHRLSGMSQGPFIPVNCGAFPETLLDSELFGHAKGAFTGAVVNKRGLIEEADGGTLLLDEIGEAPPSFQVRLLRFLDNGGFRRVGEVQERKSRVRIIAATNRDLEKDIEDKRFRKDLYYRLSVAVISIPPLRQRKEDIPVLCRHFLQIYAKRMNRPVPRLHPQVVQTFENFDWPGNVRELENTIENVLVVSKGDEIGTSDLPPKFGEVREKSADVDINQDMPLEEMEKRYILSVLKRAGGNRKRAAEILNISRTTLIARIKSANL
jgi:two-component system response regulator PilR (NtrC family)